MPTLTVIIETIKKYEPRAVERAKELLKGMEREIANTTIEVRDDEPVSQERRDPEEVRAEAPGAEGGDEGADAGEASVSDSRPPRKKSAVRSKRGGHASKGSPKK